MDAHMPANTHTSKHAHIHTKKCIHTSTNEYTHTHVHIAIITHRQVTNNETPAAAMCTATSNTDSLSLDPICKLRKDKNESLTSDE